AFGEQALRLLFAADIPVRGDEAAIGGPLLSGDDDPTIAEMMLERDAELRPPLLAPADEGVRVHPVRQPLHRPDGVLRQLVAAHAGSQRAVQMRIDRLVTRVPQDEAIVLVEQDEALDD